MDSLDNSIKNENKIPGSPGCDSFTRPEEISALSKFLGNIKRNQEQNLNLNDSLEDIPGKTTGLFPEIKNLNEDYIKLSSGEQSKITELGNTFVPLDAPVFDEEIGSLPQHLIGLNTKNFELELDNELITLEDKRDLKLDNELITLEDKRDLKLDNELITLEDKRDLELDNELITLEDKRDLKLDNELITLEDKRDLKLDNELITLEDKRDLKLDNELITLEDKRSLELENTKEELEVNNKIKTLEKEKVNLKVNKVDKLEKTKLKLSDTQKAKTLEDTVINLSGNLIDPKLSEEKQNLLVEEKKISLDDTRILIDNNVNEVEMLENTLIDLELDNDITLEEDLVKLNIGKNEPNLEKEKIKLEIEEDDIDILPEIRDDLVVRESIKSLDNNIINLVKDDLFNSDPELDETRVDIVNPKIIDNLDKSKINLLNTETKTELRDQLVELVKENTNPNKLEGSVVDLILPNTKTELKEDIIKLNNKEEKIKLENTKLELETSFFTKKQLDKSIVILNTDKTCGIELEKDVVKLRKDNTETALDENVVKLNNIKNLDNLEETALRLDNIDEVSELDNILVELDGVNVTNELSNGVVTIKLSEDITKLDDTVELLSNTESILSLEDYIDKLGDSLSPVNSRDGKYDWFDNRVDDGGNSINETKDTLDSTKEKLLLGTGKLSGEDEATNSDWLNNRSSDINIDDYIDKVLLDPEIVNTKKQGQELININYIDIRSRANGEPVDSKSTGKFVDNLHKEILDTDLSDNIIPSLNSDYDWFDNTPDSNENLIYTEDDRVDLSTTISDDDLPLLSQTEKDKDHDWIDNRVKDSGSPETLNQDTLESKKSRKNIDTDLSDNIIPRLDSDYDWFDNTSDSDENLIYTEDDRELIETNISFNEIPRINTNNPYDWFDNRVDDGGNSINETKDTLDSTKEKLLLGTGKLSGEDEATNSDWLNNRSSDINIDDYIDEILLNPEIVNTKKQGQELININYIDIRSKANGEPVDSKSAGKFVDNLHKEILDTDLSDNIIPNPESNYTWLNNSDTDDIDFELGDNYLEMKSPVTGQSEYTISDQDIPRLPTAGEDNYEYKYLSLGKIDVDNNLHYKYVKSLEEIDLYNEILNFKYSFIPPSVIGINEGSREGTRLDNGLDTEYDRFGKDPKVLEPEWLLFIKAITTAYLRPGEDEKIDLSKLESFKESILSLIRSNKVLREKGLLKIKTPTKVHYNDGEKLKSELDYGNDEGISLDLIPEENRGKDYSWIDNRVNDSGSPKTLNQTTLDSKKSIKDIDTDLSDNIIPSLESDYDWLDNRVNDSESPKTINQTTLDSKKSIKDIDTDLSDDKIPRLNSDYDWFDNRDSSSEELPNYMKHGPRSELPKFDLSLDLLSRNFSISNFLRYGAENTVGAAFDLLFKEDKFEWHTPILKEARRKLLEETLAALIVGRDALEKVTKSQRHRLPGDDNHLGILGNIVSGDVNAKGLVKNLISEFMSPETDDPVNRPDSKGKTEVWKMYSKRPGEGDYYTTEGTRTELIDRNSENSLNFWSHYLQGKGLETTLTELCGFQKIKDVKSVEDFYTLLKTSPYFTTSNKVTTTDSGYKVMTLDSNAHWEIILEPYVGSLNNKYTFLPLIEEINIRNKELHGIQTNYNHWIPIISFELQKERLYSRTLGLFNGEINYPISMESTNEFRITLADDQYKSWRNYFERCAQASVYSSTPNVYDKSKDKIGIEKEVEYTVKREGYFGKNGEVFSSDEILQSRIDTVVEPITIDKEYRLVAPYKNITFRCKVLVMTPQLSTINRYDLLLVLKDVTEERSGEIDSSGTDLNLSFCIVGENPGDEISDSRFSNVKSDKDSINKISTWRDISENKGIGNAILNSALSIL